MPRSEVANKRARQDARARILAGARMAFARKGMAATMTDVAVSAGVSQGLPYRYFTDKDALVRALVTEAVQQADAGGSPLARPGTAAERLRALVTSLAEARRDQPELFLLFQHVISDPGTPRDLLELIQARGHAVTTAMRQLVTEAQAAGDAAPDDPDQLVTAVMACLDGLGRFTLGNPGQAAQHFPAAQIITRILQLPQPPPSQGHPRHNRRGKHMSAEEIWHAQMEAVRQGDWDTMSGYFAADCTWTLMPPGTTFRGPAEIVTFLQSGFGAAAEREEADVRNEFATSDWGVFEYTSRGVIDARRAAQFAQKIRAAGHDPDDLAGQSLEGRKFEIPVCFVYHVNANGQIDKVNEYAAMPALPAAP